MIQFVSLAVRRVTWKQSHWFDAHYDLTCISDLKINQPKSHIILSQYMKSLPKYQANDDPCIVLYASIVLLFIFFYLLKGETE